MSFESITPSRWPSIFVTADLGMSFSQGTPPYLTGEKGSHSSSRRRADIGSEETVETYGARQPDLIVVRRERWERALADSNLANPATAVRSEAEARSIPIYLIDQDAIRTTFSRFEFQQEKILQQHLLVFFLSYCEDSRRRGSHGKRNIRARHLMPLPWEQRSGTRRENTSSSRSLMIQANPLFGLSGDV